MLPPGFAKHADSLESANATLRRPSAAPAYVPSGAVVPDADFMSFVTAKPGMYLKKELGKSFMTLFPIIGGPHTMLAWAETYFRKETKTGTLRRKVQQLDLSLQTAFNLVRFFIYFILYF